MGCCNSKLNTDINDQVSNRSSVINSRFNQQAPPIVITKAHSIASSVDSSLSHLQNAIAPPAIITAATTATDSTKQDEKPPVIIEEQTQEHQYGCPPDKMPHKKATMKDIKPMIINTPDSMSDPTLIPVMELPLEEQQEVLATVGLAAVTSPSLGGEEDRRRDLTTATIEQPPSIREEMTTATTTTTTTWPILVRSTSNGTQMDKQVNIPTTAPFMTVSQLKTILQLKSTGHQQIKLIYLGRILQDHFSLVPASCSLESSNKKKKKDHVVKLVNKGVIQAMIYDKK